MNSCFASEDILPTTPTPISRPKRLCPTLTRPFARGRYQRKLEQAKVENKQLGCEVAAMGGRMEHAQKETKAMKVRSRLPTFSDDLKKRMISTG